MGMDSDLKKYYNRSYLLDMNLNKLFLIVFKCYYFSSEQILV